MRWRVAEAKQKLSQVVCAARETRDNCVTVTWPCIHCVNSAFVASLAATWRTMASRSSGGGSEGEPLTLRNTKAARAAVRLLPSRKGWFWEMWKR